MIFFSNSLAVISSSFPNRITYFFRLWLWLHFIRFNVLGLALVIPPKYQYIFHNDKSFEIAYIESIPWETASDTTIRWPCARTAPPPSSLRSPSHCRCCQSGSPWYPPPRSKSPSAESCYMLNSAAALQNTKYIQLWGFRTYDN